MRHAACDLLHVADACATGCLMADVKGVHHECTHCSRPVLPTVASIVNVWLPLANPLP